jgi:CDP-diacylglycerol---glycerol-3-phosphate 3-phosphatidyltransferase
MDRISHTDNSRSSGNTAAVSIFNPANALTAFRIVLVPLYIWLFACNTWESLIFALIAFVTAAVTDLYDGRLARSRKEITKLGKFMDPLADKFLVVGALVQFWMAGLVWFWFVVVIVVRDMWVTAMRISAIARGTELKTSGDAKLKTTIQLTAIITTIVFYGARLIVMRFAPSYQGFFVDLAVHRLLYNGLVAVAAAFTVYSWITYLTAGSGKHS